MGLEADERARVAKVAREWIGTPFHDQAEVKGRDGGVDCATLLKRVYIEAGLIREFDIGYYSPQHFLHQTEERFLGWVSKFAKREVTAKTCGVGDIVLYRIGLCYAHGAIVVDPGWPTIVHAHSAGRVVRRANGLMPHLGEVLAVKFFSFW